MGIPVWLRTGTPPSHFKKIMMAACSMRPNDHHLQCITIKCTLYQEAINLKRLLAESGLWMLPAEWSHLIEMRCFVLCSIIKFIAAADTYFLWATVGWTWMESGTKSINHRNKLLSVSISCIPFSGVETSLLHNPSCPWLPGVDLPYVEASMWDCPVDLHFGPCHTIKRKGKGMYATVLSRAFGHKLIFF